MLEWRIVFRIINLTTRSLWIKASRLFPSPLNFHLSPLLPRPPLPKSNNTRTALSNLAKYIAYPFIFPNSILKTHHNRPKLLYLSKTRTLLFVTAQLIIVQMCGSIVGWDQPINPMFNVCDMMRQWLMMGKTVIVLTIFLGERRAKVKYMTRFQRDTLKIFSLGRTRLYLLTVRQVLGKRIQCLGKWIIEKTSE